MFGFGFRGAPVLPTAASRRHEDEEDFAADAPPREWTDFAADEVVLVSKEDIYAREGRQTVLLLKKGREITVGELPRLMKYGVHPEQFWLKQAEPSSVETVRGGFAYQSDPMRHFPMTPISRASKAVRARQSLLVLDTDAKSLRRTTDCLFRCGFSLGRIHPVRMPAHLSWSLHKYQPDILVMDYHLGGGHSALELIRGLGEPTPTDILLTLSLSVSDEEQAMIHEATERFGLRVLLKPLSRPAVHAVLEQQGL